mmetsp:Transcript_16445/g.37924  ORF Transcript_16445/g.37924 Transcript_16445/m.37924 type:complete len:595 (+) Transcript_16445:319-2103(+)
MSQLAQELVKCARLNAGGRACVGVCASRHVCCLRDLSSENTAVHQGSVCLLVGAQTFGQGSVKQVDRLLWLPVLEACLYETSVDLDVCLKAVLLGDRVHNVESLREPLAPAKELDQHAQSVVGGYNTIGLHVVNEPQSLADALVPCTAVQQAVVHHLIWHMLLLALHGLKERDSLVNVACRAVSFDQGRNGDHVGLNRRLAVAHVIKQLWDSVHSSTLREAIQHGVVGDGVALYAKALHLLVHGHHLGWFMAKTLKHCGVCDYVHQALCCLVRAQLADQAPSSACLPVRHQCFNHAAQGNGRGLYVALSHLLPQPPHFFHVASEAIGLDQRTIGRGCQEPPALLVVLGENVAQDLQLTCTDTNVDECSQQHIIHGLLDLDHECQDALDVFALTLGVNHPLQQDGAGHCGWAHVGGLHLLNNSPRPFQIARSRDFGIQHCMIVRLGEGLAHAKHCLQDLFCLVQAGIGEVAPDHAASNIAIDKARGHGLHEVCLCLVDSLAINASLNHRLHELVTPAFPCLDKPVVGGGGRNQVTCLPACSDGLAVLAHFLGIACAGLLHEAAKSGRITVTDLVEYLEDQVHILGVGGRQKHRLG